MASINKITDIIMAIKTIYSYYARDTDIEQLAKTWYGLLAEYDDKTVEVAMFKCLQTCKTPPTPADVIEQITAMYKTLAPSDEDLWVTYEKALRDTNRQIQRFHETYIDSTGISSGQQARNKVDEIWAGLPEKIKSYLGSKGELMRNAREWNMSADYCTFEKPRFLKAMPVMEKRQEYGGLMLEGGANSNKFLIKGD